MKINLLHKKARVSRGTSSAAGIDLHAITCGEIRPGFTESIGTGISLDLPSGFFGSIRPKSGLAGICGIDTMAGVIDSDYTGEIIVLLVNHGTRPFAYEAGDKVAQLIIQKHYTDHMKVPALTEEERGESGFGSTGK